MDADHTTAQRAAGIAKHRLELLLPERRQLADYELIAELAHDGMGVVYLAVRRSELVLVKELREEFVDNPSLVQMFMEDARLAALLDHPNIPRTTEGRKVAGRCFIAMEGIEGQPLNQLVRRAVTQSKRLPLPTHLHVLLEVLSALECAHNATDGRRRLDIVHGDVSPGNVLVTYGGQVKLLGFGISKTFGALTAESPDGAAVERVRYMAPEQAAGKPMDGRADLFAVGVMLWEAIADRRPWDDQPDEAVWRSLRSGAVPRIRDAWPYIDPGLCAIVDRSMSATLDHRYRTALEMRCDLERYITTSHARLPTAESLGNLVARLFAEDRDRQREQVETARGASVAQSAPLSPSQGAKAGASSITPLALPTPRASGSNRSRSRWPVAVSACVGALFALAAITAASLHTGHGLATAAPPAGAPPVALVASAVRASIPLVSIDDIPRVPSLVAPTTPPPSAPRGLAPSKPVAHVMRTVSTPEATSGCDPPYSVEPETGKKQWRLECL